MTNVIARLFTNPGQNAEGWSELAGAGRAKWIVRQSCHSADRVPVARDRTRLDTPPGRSFRSGPGILSARVKAAVTAFLWLSCCGVAMAQEPSAVAKREISHLFHYLEQSGCEFQRNGTWHGAGKAAGHLKKKYVYLLAKELVPTTEAFIERAASKSSLTGRTYRVRCAGSPAMESRVWFAAELLRTRKPPG